MILEDNNKEDQAEINFVLQKTYIFLYFLRYFVEFNNFNYFILLSSFNYYSGSKCAYISI